MEKDQINAQEVLKEKQMEELYRLKDSSHFDLPIAQHQITLHYKARFKYSVVEYQFLRYIAVCEKIKHQYEIVEALGISTEDVERILTNLKYDRVIEMTNEGISMTILGEVSLLDGFSPLRQEVSQFDFYYEPITSFVAIDIQQLQEHNNSIHPIIHSENYLLFDCPYIEKAEILPFYEETFGQSLTFNTKDFTIISIQHEGVESKYHLPVQNLQLFELEKGEEILSVWNSKNKRFIHLA